MHARKLAGLGALGELSPQESDTPYEGVDCQDWSADRRLGISEGGAEWLPPLLPDCISVGSLYTFASICATGQFFQPVNIFKKCLFLAFYEYVLL